MHTAEELRSGDLGIAIGGRAARLADLFPGFRESDRLGVVVRQPGGAVGASALILAAVTAFYDFQRERSAEFFIYPDYFVFHVGGSRGDHRMLDIWPSHKEVVVPDQPEAVLRAINDRAVTRLLVEDIGCREATLERESLASARNRITTCLAYSPSGRARDADVTLTGNSVTESYVSAVLEHSTVVDAGAKKRIQRERAALLEAGRPIESSRRIALEEALAMLAG